jgi:hypothetical protein
MAASTSMLFLRMLPPNEAWLLVFRAGGRFHPGIRHAGGDDPDAPHGFVDFRRWHSNLVDTVQVVIPTGLRVRMLNREPAHRSESAGRPNQHLKGQSDMSVQASVL